MFSFLEKLSGVINRAAEYSLSGLGLGMSVIVAAQVFSRYGFNHSLFWSEELARFLLVWLTFLGAGVAYRRGVHASLDLFYHHLPPAWRRTTRLVVHLGALLFSGIMVWHGAGFAWFVRFQISPALHLPKWIPHGALPVAGAIIFLHAFCFLCHELKGATDDR
ncbi:MAG: TRAP transporter small permease [Thermodesulfobacteriota bacterium]